MAVVHFSLIVEYAMGERSQEENFARTQDLIARLCKIHPLLSTISPQGKAGSWQRMESEPLLQNITFEQWLAYYAHRSLDMPVSLGATINYWNRHRSKGTYTLIQCLSRCRPICSSQPCYPKSWPHSSRLLMECGGNIHGSIAMLNRDGSIIKSG
jgi:hypothetical protein